MCLYTAKTKCQHDALCCLHRIAVSVRLLKVLLFAAGGDSAHSEDMDILDNAQL